jgi:hypothetical protein
MRKQLISILKRSAIVEGVVWIGVGLVCLVGSWRSVKDYSTALLVAGAVLFATGPFSLMLAGQNRRISSYQYIQSTQMHQLIRDSQNGQAGVSTTLPGFVYLLMVDGAVTVGLALVLQAVSG